MHVALPFLTDSSCLRSLAIQANTNTYLNIKYSQLTCDKSELSFTGAPGSGFLNQCFIAFSETPLPHEVQ